MIDRNEISYRNQIVTVVYTFTWFYQGCTKTNYKIYNQSCEVDSMNPIELIDDAILKTSDLIFSEYGDHNIVSISHSHQFV
jgi:hypothetical protein